MKQIFTGLIFAAICASAQVQVLTVDQHGVVSPPGYVAGLSDIAQAEAAAEVTRQSAELVDSTARAASNIVDQIVFALTGSIGFGYVTGHVVSFAGAVEISTNATSQIVYLDLGSAGTSNILEEAYTGHYVWHVYSESLGSYPAIKYKTNLDATNSWEVAEYQSTAEYTKTTINGVEYSVIYRSTVWLPSSYTSAFLMAFCESTGGGQAGGYFDVQTGFSIGGQTGFTGDITECGYLRHYECGALMTATPTNEVPQ